MTNKYLRPVGQRTHIDVYDVCEIFCVNDPSGATQHAIKKLLCSGSRGYKDQLQDLREAAQAVERRIAMLGARGDEAPTSGRQGNTVYPRG